MKGKVFNAFFSLLLVSVLVLGCFAAVPLNASTDPTSVTADPEIFIKKTVNGEAFDSWIKKNYPDDVQQDAIVAGMSFELYKVDGKNARIPPTGPVEIGRIDKLTGVVDFTPWFKANTGLSGWYAVVEKLSGKAAEIFELVPDDEILYIQIGATGRLFFNDFDYDALYTINYNTGSMTRLGYPGLNNQGDIFYIGVVNPETKVEYVSFCAHANSQRFAGDNSLGCRGYMISVPDGEIGDIADYVSAFNYIEDKYGDLNENRIITQTVIWALLGAIDVDSPAFANANLTSEEKAAIQDVLANHVAYTGKRTITNAVYMICEEHGVSELGLSLCQPQIVPIYGKLTINNRAVSVGSIEVRVDVTRQYDKIELQDVYAQDWYDLYAQDFYDVYEQDQYDVYARDWYNVYAQNWYDVYAQDWYKVFAQDWYERFAQDWYKVYAQDFYDVYEQDWYKVYAQDWYNVFARDFYDVFVQVWYNVYVQDNSGEYTFVETIFKDPIFIERVFQDPRFVESIFDDPAALRLVAAIFDDPDALRFVETVVDDPEAKRPLMRIFDDPDALRFVETVVNDPVAKRFVKTEEVSRITVKDAEYTDTFNLLITDWAGIPVYNEPIANDGNELIGGLLPGEYTVTLSGIGIASMTITVTVNAAETAIAEFKYIITGPEEKTQLPDKIVDGVQLDDVVEEGVQLDDVVNPGKQLPDRIVDGVRLDDVVVDGEQVADRIVDGVRLDDVVVDGEQLPDVYLEAEIIPPPIPYP